jgi:hypothetical protein
MYSFLNNNFKLRQTEISEMSLESDSLHQKMLTKHGTGTLGTHMEWNKVLGHDRRHKD